MNPIAVRAVSLGAFAALAIANLSAQDLPVRGESSRVELRYASFDPGRIQPEIPGLLQGGADTNLWIVQFAAAPTESARAAVRAIDAEIHTYLPENAYVVRMPLESAVRAQQLRDVRSVIYYHPAFRLESVLRVELQAGADISRRYNIVVVDKRRDKPGLARQVAAVGGRIDDFMEGSLLMQATLTSAQLLRVARLDEVLWIDRWGAPEDDMDNARIQGGGDYVESVGGYTGKGIIGHQYEGLEVGHRDWNNRPIGYPSSCASSSGHGHNTAGIVYGNGTSAAIARGMAPDAQAYFTSCRTNRWANFNVLVNTHNIMFTTASWGSPRTRQYTSVSAEADDICFDHDLVWSNSQSNAHNQDSRAEAWAKNVFSVGGVRHNNNSNPGDDSWQASGASIGPASDGRIKPDFTAYYDNIATSAVGGGYSSSFGGTSGATPIVAGHNALAIQMFTDGVFGNVLRNPSGSRFDNKPRFPTLKALQMANASQYPFNATSTDNLRIHQGWGFPNLRSMWDNRKVMFIVDEEDVIKNGTGMAYTLAVPAGRSELKVSMSFSDPAANPASTLARINDLTLRVTAPNGRRYWGNAGLEDGNYSVTGGSRDKINTTENVFVRSPAAGRWLVEVIGYMVVQDSHVETAAVDADFGLVVNGATFVSKKPISVAVGSINAFGTGCLGTGKLPSYCASLNASGGSVTRVTRSWTYAYEARASSSTLSVSGFELWTASVSGGSVSLPVAIYRASGSGPASTPVATSTMTVGGSEAFYKATFNPPVTIPANTTFFVAMTHNNQSYISSVTGGTPGAGYWLNGSWSLSSLATAPSYRVLCSGGGSKNAVPVFEVEGTPEIGMDLQESLRLAAPNTLSLLISGLSDKTWSGGALPFNLAPLGAPACRLYVNLLLFRGYRTDANGNVQIKTTIPTNPSLVGSRVFEQWMVIDPSANNFGAAMTNAVRIVVGG